MAAGITQTLPAGEPAAASRTAPAGQPLRVRLLGEFAITAGGRTAGPWPRPSARRLCAFILVSHGRRVTRDLACEELFPALEPRTAARSLSKALSMARAALAELGEAGTALLGADLTHVWISPEVSVDADTQAAGLQAGLAKTPGEQRDAAIVAALADDEELLPGEPYAEWADRARDRLNALRQQARLTLARDRAKGAGRSGADDVAAAWLACFEHDPASEEAAAALIRGYLAGGRPGQAVRVFEGCRAALEQLGLRISPSLERIYTSSLAAHTPAVAAPPAPAASAELAGQSADGRPASPPRAERRPLTVLFAEVAAAPAGLTGTLGLEELRDLVGGSLASVIAEVEAMGGTVSSVSGRGLQAMFGAPEAHEDDPERAVRAAYRAIAAVAGAPLTGDHGPVGTGTAAGGGPGLRIGIESGPALVGPIGGGAKVEYAALGDVVSVAAALQSAARPGSVLIGPATRRAVAHLFTWGTQEEVTLSPDAKPVTAGYLEAPRATAAERRPRIGGRAALVGRQAEVRLLDTALRAAVGGRGQVVVLHGEPGIGKTRLVQESRKRFIAWVGASTGRRPLWLEGRGTSYASATPYSVYRQLIAGWVGVAIDQPADRQRAALADALTHLMGNTNLLPPLAHLMGLPQPAGPSVDESRITGQSRRRIGAGEQQRQAFAAVRALVTRFTATAPTVLVLEDLHWADPTSLRLTAELAELAVGRPLLLLATTRWRIGQGSGAAAAPVLAAAQAIRLRRLGDTAAETLATSLLGQVDQPEVLTAALASADGNPLFVEERLAEMLETGVLVRDQGSWRLRAADQVVLSQVLERLVRSRVDRLSPAAAEAIRAASVLGAEFTAETLAATLGSQPPALAAVLDELVDSDLVHHEPPDSAKPVFRFRHALIQDATYLALLRNERRDLHARAARALEAAFECDPAEVATVLGRHYAIAEDADRAVRYLELGGDHATDAFANDEAIAAFREAIAATARGTGPGAARQATAGDGGDRDMVAAAVRLQAKLANVLWRTAHREGARAAFEAALRSADAGPRPLGSLLRAHLYTRLGRLELVDLRFTKAAKAFDAADALLALDAAAAGDPGLTDDATADQWLELMVDGRSELHAMRYEPDLAFAVLELASPVLETRGTPARKTAFYRLRTTQRMQRNRLRVDDEDIAGLRASVAEAEKTGEDKAVGYAGSFLGWALWLRGDLAEADAELRNALSLANRIGESHLRSLALLTLTLTALRSHDVEGTRALLPQAFAAADTAGYPNSRAAGRLACAAWLAWQDSRPDEVIRLGGEIEKYDPSTTWSGGNYGWVYLFPLIATQLQAGQTEAAVTAARQAIGPSQQWLPDDLTAALAAAGESWDREKPAEASEHLTRALALARTRRYF
jgi:class 3 adenylate cyclase/tetratricopeptide (TPR) repeat protein